MSTCPLRQPESNRFPLRAQLSLGSSSGWNPKSLPLNPLTWKSVLPSRSLEQGLLSWNLPEAACYPRWNRDCPLSPSNFPPRLLTLPDSTWKLCFSLQINQCLLRECAHRPAQKSVVFLKCLKYSTASVKKMRLSLFSSPCQLFKGMKPQLNEP